MDTDIDVRRGDKGLNQVARHRALERGAADEQGHTAGVRREVHRRLPGRVAAADDVDVLSGQGLALGDGAAVEQSGADERSTVGIPSRRYAAPVARITLRARGRRPFESERANRDERARAGLPADRLSFDHQCAQTVRGCIHRSGQPAGPAATRVMLDATQDGLCYERLGRASRTRVEQLPTQSHWTSGRSWPNPASSRS
jgi:hypothetical protein